MVRQAISAAIRRCSRSREQIADEMTRLLGIRVTVAMLNDYSATAKRQHRWPAAWDRVFSSVTGDNELLTCRVRAAGLIVIGPTEWELLELGTEYLRQKRAAEKLTRIEQSLKGVDL
jgi:hypothetical protein